jgi:hypothetical protein
MKIILAFTLFCLCSFSLFAQNTYSIRGLVADTTSKAKLANTSITVLNSKDSTLVKFGRAATDGSFSLNLEKGKFILLVAYPEYADYVSKFELDSVNRTHDFKQISLKLKSRLLEEAVINGVAAITIKGDTTVFSTSKLVIQPNANVEDLLKQLPGIQVDQNGVITAQGQKVEKVLVDGEEFFGDDPTLVTRNIRGDMVKSFELYDKKSDQAAFTGIDDGVKIKTINVKLKDDSKRGYFGKVDAGVAPTTYYQGQAMYNNFIDKKKMAAYGTIGNTGKTGLGFQDASKYGANSNNIQAGDGGLFLVGNSDELESFNGTYNGQGIPLAISGGTHFDSKWNKDKETFNANYKVGSLSVDGSQNMIKQTVLPGSSFTTSSDQDSHNYMFRQKLDATYEVKVNKNSTLKFIIDGTLKNSETDNANLGSYKRSDSTLINTSDRRLSNNVDQRLVNASGLLTTRFKKAGRTFSLNISESASSSDAKGYLNTTNKFYDTTEKLTGTTVIDQYKTSVSKSSNFGSNMTWSEPFSKTFAVILNYGLTLRNESALRNSFNKSSVTDKYDSLDPKYSSNFDLNNITNQFGAIFNYSKKKTVINFGTRLSAVSFNQTDLDNHIKYKMNYLVWAPQARYTYRFSQQKSLSFNYSGSTGQPSLAQVQPIRVNDDPLNIILGNPDLKPTFRNFLLASFNSFKVLTGRTVSGYTSYSLTSNPFLTSRITDPISGISSSQTLNAKNPNSVFVLGAYVGWKLKKSGINLGFDINSNASHYQDVINGITYRSRYSMYSIGPSISNTKLKKYTYRLSVGPQYKRTISNTNINDANWAVGSNGELTLYLPGKTELSTTLNYAYTERTSSFDQVNNPFIWNSSISKKFLKKENLKFSLSGSDLLKQKVGYNRAAFQQTTYNTVSRYFMGSVTWDFTKMASQTKK